MVRHRGLRVPEAVTCLLLGRHVGHEECEVLTAGAGGGGGVWQEVTCCMLDGRSDVRGRHWVHPAELDTHA